MATTLEHGDGSKPGRRNGGLPARPTQRRWQTPGRPGDHGGVRPERPHQVGGDAHRRRGLRRRSRRTCTTAQPNAVVGYDQLADAIRLMTTLRDDSIVADLSAARSSLPRKRSPSSAPIASASPASAWAGASASWPRARLPTIKAAAPFYGGGIGRPARSAPPKHHLPDAALLRRPGSVHPERRGRQDQADAGRPEEDRRGRSVYPGAPHGFFCNERDSYRARCREGRLGAADDVSRPPSEVVKFAAGHAGASRARGARLVLTCEHASPPLPAEYANLGLVPAAVARPHRLGHRRGDGHRGAEPATDRAGRVERRLAAARRLQSRRRRRRPDAARRATASPSPATPRIEAAERDATPATLLRAVPRGGRYDGRGTPDALLLSIHSFTPELNGRQRPFDVGVLFDAYDDLAAAPCRRRRGGGLRGAHERAVLRPRRSHLQRPLARAPAFDPLPRARDQQPAAAARRSTRAPSRAASSMLSADCSSPNPERPPRRGVTHANRSHRPGGLRRTRPRRPARRLTTRWSPPTRRPTSRAPKRIRFAARARRCGIPAHRHESLKGRTSPARRPRTTPTSACWPT